MESINIDNINSNNIKKFKIGDTIKVGFKIVENDKERIQNYEGVVIAIKNQGIAQNFTIRKIEFGVAVERIIPIHSPKIVSINVLKSGKTRRSKLYYLRNRVGKSAKLQEVR